MNVSASLQLQQAGFEGAGVTRLDGTGRFESVQNLSGYSTGPGCNNVLTYFSEE